MFRSYVALQCEGPAGLHASKCAFRNSKLTFHLPKVENNHSLKLFESHFRHNLKKNVLNMVSILLQ